MPNGDLTLAVNFLKSIYTKYTKDLPKEEKERYDSNRYLFFAHIRAGERMRISPTELKDFSDVKLALVPARTKPLNLILDSLLLPCMFLTC